MSILSWSDLSQTERQSALARPTAISDDALLARTADVLKQVKQDGDTALQRLTEKFDDVKLDKTRTPTRDLVQAWASLPKLDQVAIQTAKANIEKFHTAQKPQPITVNTMDGVTCQRLPRAIETAGLYVPGGTAPLVSTVLMLAIPAKVAGVKRTILLSPPQKDGRINSAILAAAYVCDVDEVYACGGAQAVAAMAYGTESIPKCDKIFGPGNAYVAAAKSMVAMEAGGPAIDLPAGPSEAMVLADENSNPAFVASDLLSQAEHDTNAQVVLVCTDTDMIAQIQTVTQQQLQSLPRKEIAKAAMENAKYIYVQTRTDMIDVVNLYAPEHLIVQIESPEDIVENVQNAGSVFLGPWTPESVGDYASGTNHTLPTYGAARSYSGVTTESFIKYISVQRVTQNGLKELGPAVERLATLEDLEAHKRAVSLRLEAIANM